MTRTSLSNSSVTNDEVDSDQELALEDFPAGIKLMILRLSLAIT